MRGNDRFIGVVVPAVIADELARRKRRTGVTVTKQVRDALRRQLKISVKEVERGTPDQEA